MTRTRGNRRWLWLVPLLLIGGGVALWSTMGLNKGEELSLADLPVATVRTGPLVISVKEFGELESEKRTIISNELEWSVIIKSVVDNGTLVEQGETIIEFECKELLEAIDAQDLKVDAARLAWNQAEKNLELTKKEAANKVRKADNALTLAREVLQRYKDPGGEWDMKKNDAESEIQLAERKLKLAEEKLRFKEMVNKDPALNSPYSKNEIEADRLNVQQLQLALQKARSQKRMLIKYDHPQQLRKLREEVDQAEIDLARARLEQEINVTLAESDLRTKAKKLEKLEKKLEELKEEKAKLIVTAERDGLVIYDVGGSRWRPSNVEVKVGEKIGPRQQLMKIPDMTTLQVETEVFESHVSKVSTPDDDRPATEALITLDSVPGKVIRGHVKWIAPLPESSGPHWLKTGTKVYEVIIEPDWEAAGMKPGRDLKPDMNADVELILGKLENVISVPVAAIFSEGEKSFCWKVTNGRPEYREVTLGGMNDRRVQVLDGLSEGDEVLLTRGRIEGDDFEKPEAAEDPDAELDVPDETPPPDTPAPNTKRDGTPRRGR